MRSLEAQGPLPVYVYFHGEWTPGDKEPLAKYCARQAADATAFDDELGGHYGIQPQIERENLRGLVQHRSLVDFSVMFERGFILGMNFLRMLLPERGRGRTRHTAAWFLSPIEWLDNGFLSVFLTTSERDFFYQANLNFIEALPAPAPAYRGRTSP